MSKRLGILCLLTALCAWPGSTALADDSDIFLQTSVPPNVALLIDTSGSMNDEVDGVDKIEIAKSAMVDLVTQVEGVNFAVFAFNATGARMVAPFGTDPAVIAAKISALSAQGGTPLGRATRHIKYYFRGEWNGIDSTRDMDGSAYDDDCADGDDETMGCEAVYFGDPIGFECQQNYAVLMTDGMPNGEDVNLVAAQALEMFSQDHNSILDGKQNIIVNTIGFDVPAGAALLTTTANNGGGTFYTASNAAELRAALQASVIQAVEGSYSFSMPLVPSSRVADGDKVYVATFEPNLVAPFWEGKLLAYNRDGAGHVPVDADGLPLDSAIAWDAGALLDTRAASDRNLKTVIGGAVQDFDRSNSNLTKALLGVATDGERDDIIDFIRGIDTFDADVDGNDTEEREWKLGDIFHSKPVLVFPPPLDSPDDDYDTFKANNESRATIVLVGANDGMIHAFQASNGAELWGLVPPDLLDELGDLTPSLGDHVYYVDSSPIVADVKLNGTWKTIAVFGERRGGRSYHALDITNTSSPSYLWGFTDVDMGESWSEPRLGKIKMDGGAEKNVMFFGGGYDTTNNNASGKAFYVVDLADGSLLWKYENTASDDSQYMNFSLPASPTAADLNGDGFVDRVYAGDVGGQLWKFDVSAEATLSGGVVNNWTGKRLFVADTTAANPPAAGEFHAPAAMYGSPALAYDKLGSLWVFVGTGDRNHPKDASSNSAYGIKDNTDMTNGAALTESDLVDATGADPAVQGWYLGFAPDEKALGAAKVYNSIVYFSTYTPISTDPCADGDSVARLYAVQLDSGDAGIDFATGEKLTSGGGGGMGVKPRMTDIGGGIGSDPQISVGDSTDTVVVGTTDQELTEITLPGSATKNLRYWREVY